MSLFEQSIFETIFKQSAAPTVILKAEAPDYMIVAQNEQYKSMLSAPLTGKRAFELFVADSEDEFNLNTYSALVAAFQTCIAQKLIVKLPPVLQTEAGKVWLQTDILPVIEGDQVTYLICQTFDISKQVILTGETLRGIQREHDLTEELAASNEELRSSNEELHSSNEELRQSQEHLFESNLELEQRVDDRTKALSNSESRFRTMVEQSPVPMLVTMGEAMIFEIINQPMLDLIGKDSSVLGMPWHEALPELDGQDIITNLLDTYDSGQSWEGSEVPIMIRKNGQPELGFYNITNKPLTENGKTIGMLQSAIDVSDLVKSRLLVEDLNREQQGANEELAATNEELAATNEELQSTNEELNSTQERLQGMVVELAESEDRFRTMAESAEVMIAVADESGRATYFNKAWTILTGKSIDDLLEFGWSELIHPEDKERWMRNYINSVAQQVPVHGEFRILSERDGYRWLLANIPVRLRPDGSFAGHISSCIDITDRKNNEQQLAQMIDMLPASVVVIRGNDLIVEAINDANLAYWNKTRDQVIGNPFLKILPDLADQPFAGQLRHVMKTGEIIDVKESPVLFTNSDGLQRETFVDYTYQALTDTNGERTGVLVMSFEITDRVISRRMLEQFSDETQALNEELTASNEELASVNEELLTAQKKIEESEIAMRLAIDAAELGTWHIHSVTREFITDARLKELFGYYPDEPLSIEQAVAQITDEYRTIVAEALENAIYNHGDYDVTYPVIGLHDERLRWLRAIGNLKVDPAGGYSSFTGVVQDITEQITAIEKIKQGEETLRIATESAELATWYLDEKLGTITASPRFNELFGFYPDEKVPYNAAVSQIVPEYRQMVLNAVQASFNGGANFNVEYPIIGYHDKKSRWIRSVGKYVADPKSGNYITGVMLDITEQKTDELRKNDFIGMVSHELKTPLTSLTAIVQVTNSKLKHSDDKFLAGAMEKASTQVKKMSSMINGFLNISRLESGKLMISKSPFQLEELLTEVIEETAAIATSHDIRFEPSNETEVNGDRDKLGSVVSNLISNAIKYSPKGKNIIVTCQAIEGYVQVSVKDEGIGIKQNDAEKLFERYYRVEDTHTKHISGFGIGLYLSAEIVKRHEGNIWVDSEIGAGSTFHFSLPI